MAVYKTSHSPIALSYGGRSPRILVRWLDCTVQPVFNTVADPENWSASDVRRWLHWLMVQYSGCVVTSYDVRDDDWMLNGAQLCQLSITELYDRFPRNAGFVLAELQLWKNFGPLGNLT